MKKSKKLKAKSKKVVVPLKDYKYDENVFFKLKGFEYRYEVRTSFLNNPEGPNDAIFDKLGLDKIDFSYKIYGYRSTSGGFPEWRTDEQKNKIIRALMIECAKQSGNKTIKDLSPKFILQYMIDEDPIEEFQTMKEVKKRIEVLALQRGRDFKVYKVSKLWIPTVEKKEVVSIKGL